MAKEKDACTRKQDAKTRGLLQPANEKGACTSKQDAKSKMMMQGHNGLFKPEVPLVHAVAQCTKNEMMRCGGTYKSPKLS